MANNIKLNKVSEFKVETFLGATLGFFDEMIENKEIIGIFGIPYYKGSYIEDYDENSLEYIKKESSRFCDINSSTYLGSDENNFTKKIYYYGDYNLEKENLYNQIKKSLIKIYKSLFFPVFVCGDHSITYYLVKGLLELYSNEDFYILHFDAHYDRNEYLRSDSVMQGNVITAIEKDFNVNVVSYGVRGIVPKQTSNNTVSIDYLKEYIKMHKKKKLYITCDFDVFNTNLISSVTYPVIDGIDFAQYKEIIDEIKKNDIQIIGVDFVEFNAKRGIKDISASNVSQIIYYTINAFRK